MKPVDPNHTKRAEAFRLWMQAPMPMVTLFKTLDVTPLVRWSRRRGGRFHMLLCWCIGKAAAGREDFYLLPVGERLMQFDRIGISTVVPVKTGGVCTCDIPFSPDLEAFAQAYAARTRQVQETGVPLDLGETHMVIGTSALVSYRIDGAVNLYAGVYNNPFLIWGQYRREGLRYVLPLSFQFHHTQLDGTPAAQFLEDLQTEIRSFSGRKKHAHTV